MSNEFYSEGSIKVNLTSLEETCNTIKNLLSEVQAAEEKAKAAGERAIAAVGGSSTRIGAAITENVAKVNEDAFKMAIENIGNYIDGLTKSKTNLSNEEDALVGVINKFSSGYNTGFTNTIN